MISSQCRLMCYEAKPHVKQWLMLTNPMLAKDFNKFMLKSEMRCSTDDLDVLLADNSSGGGGSSKPPLFTSINKKFQEVPLLLRDPTALLLLFASNMPSNFDKETFNCIVSSVFNVVFVQAVIDVCKEFDQEERKVWISQGETVKNLIF